MEVTRPAVALICELSEQLDQLSTDQGYDTSLLETWTKQAESGSEAHQYILGKYHYLRSEATEAQSEGGDGRSTHGTQAVDWLVRASRQGNVEATGLLAECCDKNIGVSESNLLLVRWCLQTPENEKRARVAAHTLFQRLKLSADNDPSTSSVSKERFRAALEQEQLDSKEKKIIAKAGKLKSGGDVEEEEFVEKLMSNLHGYGSSLGKLLQRDVEWEAYSSATWLQKVTRYPGRTLTWLADNAIEVTGKNGMKWLASLIPTNQIYMLMIFFVYSLLSAQVIFWFLPLFLFYSSFATILICTLQMFYTKRKTRDVKALADMLTKFNEALSSDSAESAYTWQSLTPYVVFFIGLVTAIITFLMADKTWIPCSEMSFIATFLTIGCFFALSDKYDHLAILSMVLDSISTLPALLVGFPKIPVVYHILSVFIGAGFTIELLPDMYLQIGLPSLAYLAIPVLLLKMAKQQSWQGTYRVLVPHLVCFFWWRLAMMFFKHSSWMGMVRASVGWVSFIVLLPFLVVVMFIWAAMYLSSVLTFSNLLKIITTVTLLAIPAGFAFWAKKGFKIKGFSPDLKSNKIKIVLGVVFAISILPLTFLFTPPERDVRGHYLDWESYKQLCSKPHWDQTNIADAMVSCGHLNGIMVDWTGRIKKIVVKGSENQGESFINMLPWALANWLRCTYGEEYPECGDIQNTFERQTCQINKAQGRNCHMKNLDRFKFEMWVKMQIDGETVHDVRVEAHHWFKDALLKIKDDDEVNFRASLQKELGNVWPVLKLYYVRCTTCEEHVEFGTTGLTSKLMETYGIMLHVKRSFQGLWNFFLAPIVEFYHIVEE